MALQTSGAISSNDVNVELGRSGTAQFSMNGADERALAGVSSGSYGFNSFYGKSARSATMTRGSNNRRSDVVDGIAVRYGYAASGKSSYWHGENSNISSAMGSLSKTTGLITSGTVLSIQVVQYSSSCGYHLELSTNRSSNGGFTTFKLTRVGGSTYSFNRSAAGGFQQTINAYGDPDVASMYKWVWTSTSVGGFSGHAAGTSSSTLAQIHGDMSSNANWIIEFT